MNGKKWEIATGITVFLALLHTKSAQTLTFSPYRGAVR